MTSTLTMISLRQSMSEHERLEELLEAARSCYGDAVEYSRQHVVETDQAATQAFRSQLAGLALLVKQASTAEQLADTKASLEHGLKDYASHGNNYLKSLRQQFQDTSRALTEMMAALGEGNEADEQRMADGLKRLQQIAEDSEVSRVCPELGPLAGNLSRSLERIQQQNAMVVTQLRDELRTLQKAVDRGQKQDAAVPLSGIVSKQDIHATIRRCLDERMNFCLVAVRVANGPHQRRKLGEAYQRRVLAEFAERLRDLIERGTTAGAWGDDQILLHLVRPKSEAMWLADSVRERLGGPYILPGEAGARDIHLRLLTGVLEAGPGWAEGRLMTTVENLFEKLAASVD